MPPGPSVRHTRRSPPGDLPLDQLVQHSPAPHQPEQRPTNRVGTAAPSSLITTRPADGEMANGSLEDIMLHPHLRVLAAPAISFRACDRAATSHNALPGRVHVLRILFAPSDEVAMASMTTSARLFATRDAINRSERPR